VLVEPGARCGVATVPILHDIDGAQWPRCSGSPSAGCGR
jgi:hypothetical protein